MIPLIAPFAFLMTFGHPAYAVEPKSPAKPPSVANGDGACVTDLVGSADALRAEMTEYFRRQNNDGMLYATDGVPEVVRRVGDVTIVRTASGLWLMRRTKLDDTKPLASVRLKGLEIHEVEVIGQYIRVVTSGAGPLRYVHVIHDSLDQVDFQLGYSKDEPARAYDLPDRRGRVLQINTSLVVINVTPESHARTGHFKIDRLAIYEVRGTIEGVSFPTELGRLPVVAVDYRVATYAKSVHAIEPNVRDRRLYLEHSGFGPLNDSVEDGVGGATALLDIPRASVVALRPQVAGRADQNTAHVFLNTPSRRQQTLVYTWDFQRQRGFKAVPKFSTNVRLDLDTLRREKNPPGFVSYRATGRSIKNPNGEDVAYELFLNSPAYPADPNLPFLLPRTSVAFDDSAHRGVLIHSHGRRGTSDAATPNTLTHRYVYLKTDESQDTSFAFDSNIEFDHVSRKPPVRIAATAESHSGKNLPFLYAAVSGPGGPGYVIICTHTGELLWMPNLNRIQVINVGMVDKVLFWGERHRGDKVVPLFAAYNLTTRVWQAGETEVITRPFVEELKALTSPPTIKPMALRRILRHLNQPDPVFASPARGKTPAHFHRGVPLGTWTDPNLIDIRYLDRFKQVLVRFGKPTSGGGGAYLIDVNAFKPEIFGDVYDVTVNRAPGAPEVLVLASESYKQKAEAKDVVDGVPGVPSFWSEPTKRRRAHGPLENSHLTVLLRSPDGVVTKQQVAPTGRVQDLTFIKDQGNYFALGTTRVPEFARTLPGEFRWEMGTNIISSALTNPVAEPIYEDADYTVRASRASAGQSAKIVVFGKGEVLGDTLTLSAVADEITGSKVQKLFDFVFNLSGQSEQFNTQDFARAWRENDLLFVTTRGTPARGPMTYVYNLRKKHLVVVVPNYQRHFDLQGFRFYIGRADHQYPSIVAVFRQKTNQFETFFDFGQVRIDADAPDAIAFKDNQIHFKTTNGSVRVYDVRGKHFLGLLPDAVKIAVSPIEGRLGTVWNDRIFGANLPGLFERDEVMAKLAEVYPLAPGRDGLAQNLMFIAPDGAGVTSVMKNFVVRYITGQIPARYRPIFFKLNKTTASSDTSYRGTKADKYRDLRDAAVAARAAGYRLLVMIEGLHRFLPDGERSHGDEEGDFFQAFRDVMDEADFDVFATTSPSGFERLVRLKSDFMALIPRTFRMNPLSPVETARAIDGYLKEEFGAHSVLSSSQTAKLIDRVTRLNILKTRPGNTFDVVKAIVPARPASSKRAVKPKPVTDDVLNKDIARGSGVPPILLDVANAAANREKMRDYLNTRVRGVPHLVDEVVNDLFAFALDLNRPDWPIGRYLAVGPTGTGKSELIKAVLDFLFGHHDARLLISGEDFRDAGSAEKLKALIVRHVTQYPFNALQFDEFEKMHPDNRTVVLSLGDGEISGPSGQKISTALTLIYATSNLGVDDVKREIAGRAYGFRDGVLVAEDLNKDLAAIYDKAIERELKPEILNRFEHVLTFPFMTDDVAVVIAEAYLNGIGETAVHAVRARFFGANFDIHFDDAAVGYVARHFVDLELGARRLTINIEKYAVKGFLAKEVLAGRLGRDRPYGITHDRGAFVLKPMTAGPSGSVN